MRRKEKNAALISHNEEIPVISSIYPSASMVKRSMSIQSTPSTFKLDCSISSLPSPFALKVTNKVARARNKAHVGHSVKGIQCNAVNLCLNDEILCISSGIVNLRIYILHTIRLPLVLIITFTAQCTILCTVLLNALECLIQPCKSKLLNNLYLAFPELSPEC